MKQVLHLCSKIRGYFSASQSNDVGYDCRLTVVRPSFDSRSAWLKICSVLAILLTVGIGSVLGTTATFSGWSYSKGSITGGTLSGAPTGATASLTTTYTAANQMTNGNSQTLTLSGFDGYEISGVTVHVRCNKSSGAGSGTLTINGSSAGSLSSQSGLGDSYTNKSFSVTSTVVGTGGTIVITLTASASSFWCDSYSVTYETTSPHTITFNAGTGTCGTASSGSVTSYTLPSASPSASCASEGWAFAGWKESSAQSSASAPASKLWQAGETYSPAADITLYAVYFQASGNNYEYIDNLNSLFDGAKMIITAYNSGDYAVSNTMDGDGYIYSSTVSPDGDDVISSPANSIVWTLNGYKDNWTLKNVDNNKYIIVSTLPALANASETFSITYEVDEDDYDQFNIKKGSKYLYMWSSDYTFSGYNKTYLYFYQQQGTYITNPSCCTSLASINGSVSWSNAATAVVSWDDLAHVSSWTVKYKTHAAGEWSTAGASSASAGTRSVTISSLTPCTNYDFKIIATPADGYCDKSQTIEDSQTHNWTVTSTGVTNVTPATSIPSTTCTGFSIASMTPADGYSLPTSITVTNADKTWDSSTGALTISNVTGNVTITITGQVVANFTNGETVFIQADSKDYSAWKEDACVKAYFTNSGSDGALVSTNWLFDATGTDNGKKLFAIVVPASGTLNQVQLQRFQSDCLAEHWWNNNGIVTKASSNGVNTFRSYGSADNNVSWNGSSTTLYLHGDPSGDDWASSLATFADQGGGVWTATYSNYTPDVTSADFKIKTNYNVGWIGNTGSNNNATLSDMIVGSTYNVTATLDVTDHSLVMSKTFVKGEVSFDLQGHGSAISKLTNVTAGSKISAPSEPSATGYDFGGWYKEPACTNAWNFASDVVNESMTLYAKWTEKTYTITKTLTNVTNSSLPSSFTYTGSTTTALNSSFSVDATNFFLPSSITVTMGGSPLTAGTHYTYNSGTGAFTFDAVINGNIVITATATAKLKSIAITTQPTTRAYLVGETFSKTGAVVTATMGDGSTKAVTGSATWDLTTLSAGTSQTVTASYTEAGITKTATTTIDVYDVTVNKVDETGATITADGVSASATGRTLTASATSGSKYVFKGWKYGTAAGTSIASTSSASTSLTGTPTGDVTVIAEFYKPVTITWLKGGTTYETGSPTTSIAYGSQWKDLTIPTAPGDATLGACANKFMGWSNTMDVEWEADDHHTAPATLFTSVAGNTTVINADITFRAVFATADAGDPGSFTISASEIGSSYSTSESKLTKLSTNDIGFKNLMYNSANFDGLGWAAGQRMQFRNNSTNYGQLYNKVGISGLTKIRIYDYSGSSSYLTVYTGTTEKATTSTLSWPGSATGTESLSIPKNTSGTLSYTSSYYDLTVSSGHTFFYIKNNLSGTAYPIKIVVYYTPVTYTDYVTQCCANKVAISDGTLEHCTLSYSSENQPTCGDASARQVTVTVTPDAGYEMLNADGLEFSKSSGTVTASYVSGPTGSGPYTFVYQFAQNDNGAGVFNATCTPKTYRITLDPNGGSGGTEYVDVVYNTAPATFAPPTKEGYNFQGYWTNTGSPSWGSKLGNNGGTWAPNIAYYTSGGNWIRTENVTLNAKWEEKALQNYRTECPSFEVYNQDGTSAADIHLTSTKDVEIYASEAAGNLIRIIASGLDANGDHPKIGVEYYDANNGDALVTGTDRIFRLSNSSTYDYENDLLDLGENTTEYDQTFSICYVPKDYNQSHHYKLKLILRNNNTEKDNVTIDLYGRSLPKEFVIAAKSGDTWYALPNTLAATEGGQGAISPTAITVDNATTPTKVVNPVGTVIYGACNKYTNANRSGLRFTSDGAHWIQTSSTASAYKMWLSNTGYTNAQDWYLKSTDLSAYEVFMDPIGSPSDKRRIELYNSSGVKMGYHNTGATDARTGVGNVYLLPVEFPSITARIMEWGTDHVVVELRTPGSSTKVKTQIGGGAIGDEQSLASVKKDEGVYRLAVSLSSSDALKDLKLYFYNISDVLQGVAAFTIPRIVSSTTTTGSFGTPFKKDAPFVDLVILNGAALTVSETTDGTKFTFRDLYVYGNAKMVVPSGTYIDFSNVYLRGGHLDASWSYVYSHPQLVLNGTMGNTSNTINYDYLTNNAQFYSLALPYDVTLSTIVNPDFNNKQSWLIHAYDGALRASGSQVSGWYDVEEGSTEGDIDPLGSSDALTAGVGYTFFGAPQKVNSIRQKWSVNRFPMTLASGSAEVAKSGVSVTAHGMTESAGVYTLNDGVAPNDAGWNMLGNPFLADIGGTETYETAVKGTILSYHNVKTMDASGNWTGGWHWEENETNVRYVRIPNDLGTEYEQVRFKDATLRAFHHFFIQAGATGTFNFDLATRAQSMPQRIKRGKLLLPEEMDVDFRLSKEEASTKFGLTLCDDFSSDYVMNEDIAEDLSGEAMKAYTLILDQRVTYNGLPFTAAQQIIPVGFRAPNAGEYTFSYQEDENSENIEHIYLTDMRLGVVTDLKDNTYKFASEIGVVDNRFVLQIVFSSNVTTDVEETFEQENGRPLKFLYQGKIYILCNGILYDITGKRVREINK